jgi:hypothetical protein
LSKIFYACLIAALHVTCCTDHIPCLIGLIILTLLGIFYMLCRQNPT